jgi:hypothetical protein
VVTAGALIEFSSALSRPFYRGQVSAPVAEEENVARWKFRRLMAWFASEYVLILGCETISSYYVVNKMIVQFAGALCGYMSRWDEKIDISPCNRTSLHNVVVEHIREAWPALIPAFMDLIKSATPPASFAWTGGVFSIVPRSSVPEGVERVEPKDDPIFLVMTDDDSTEHSDLEVNDERTGRKRRQSQSKRIYH